MKTEQELLEAQAPRSVNPKIFTMWLFIVSIIMLFAAFTSAYLVRKAEGNWMDFDLPDAFFLSTAVIILSSIAIQKSLQAARANNTPMTIKLMGVSFMLGLAFTILQFEGWSQMHDMGVFFTGKSSNAAGSFVYVITLVHLIHLIAGLISILVFP